MGNSCWGCGNMVKETESWEMSHIYWYECVGSPGMANLRNFPFRNTKCKHYVKSEPVGLKLYEKKKI